MEKKEGIFILLTWINMMWLFLHYWNLNLTLFKALSAHEACVISVSRICLLLWDIINFKRRGLCEENKLNLTTLISSYSSLFPSLKGVQGPLFLACHTSPFSLFIYFSRALLFACQTAHISFTHMRTQAYEISLPFFLHAFWLTVHSYGLPVLQWLGNGLA